MSGNETLSRRWEDYRPSKAMWFWSAAGAAFATMILGFTVFGWTTGGSAERMAEQAAEDARAELVAQVCVEKFAAEADAAQQLVALKDASSWERDDYIEDGGWAVLVGVADGIPGAADACAERLVAMDTIPVREVKITPASTTDG